MIISRARATLHRKLSRVTVRIAVSGGGDLLVGDIKVTATCVKVRSNPKINLVA